MKRFMALALASGLAGVFACAQGKEDKKEDEKAGPADEGRAPTIGELADKARMESPACDCGDARAKAAHMSASGHVIGKVKCPQCRKTAFCRADKKAQEQLALGKCPSKVFECEKCGDQWAKGGKTKCPECKARMDEKNKGKYGKKKGESAE